METPEKNQNPPIVWINGRMNFSMDTDPVHGTFYMGWFDVETNDRFPETMGAVMDGKSLPELFRLMADAIEALEECRNEQAKIDTPSPN